MGTAGRRRRVTCWLWGKGVSILASVLISTSGVAMKVTLPVYWRMTLSATEHMRTGGSSRVDARWVGKASGVKTLRLQPPNFLCVAETILWSSYWQEAL